MATEVLKKFAEDLKAVRESKAISLQQISAKTKIDIKFLRAIEDANYDLMPDIYMCAFIKEYSSVLNLDPVEVIKHYNSARLNKTDEKIVPVQDEVKETEKKESESAPKIFESSEENQPASEQLTAAKTIFNIPLNYAVVGLTTIVLLVIVYFAFFNSSTTEIIKENTDQAVNNQRFEMENASISSTQPAPIVQKSPDSLRLTVLTTDRVWVKVSTDGKIVQQGIVPANSNLKFASKKNFSVTVGNAGLVKLLYNNKPLENIGKNGEIRNISISPEAIKYITIPPKPKNENKPAKTN